MTAAASLATPRRSQAGQSLSSWMRRQAWRLVPLISGPMICLGLSLLGLAPLLLK